MTTPETDARLEALERQAAHAEKTIEELNAVVVEQGRAIDRLKRLFEQTQDQLAAVEHLARSGAKEPPPPHY